MSKKHANASNATAKKAESGTFVLLESVGSSETEQELESERRAARNGDPEWRYERFTGKAWSECSGFVWGK